MGQRSEDGVGGGGGWGGGRRRMGWGQGHATHMGFMIGYPSFKLSSYTISLPLLSINNLLQSTVFSAQTLVLTITMLHMSFRLSPTSILGWVVQSSGCLG